MANALFDHLEKTILSQQLIANIRGERSHETLILDHEEFKTCFTDIKTNQGEMLEYLKEILGKIRPLVPAKSFIQNLK